MPVARSRRPLDEIAAAQAEVITLDQLRSEGWTLSTVTAQLAAGRWQQIHPRVYCRYTGPMTVESRQWAALLYAGRDAVFSHETAAAMWGMALPSWRRPRAGRTDQPLIHVTVPYERTVRKRPGIVVHRSRGLKYIRDPRAFPPRTTPARMVVDLIRTAPTGGRAVEAVLEAIRRRLVSGTHIAKELESERRLRHKLVVLEALPGAHLGAQNALELRYRLIESTHGLPSGIGQRLRTDGGEVRVQDIEYDEFNTVVELDGHLGHEDMEGRHRDMRRDNANMVAGRFTLRFGWVDVIDRPCEVAAMVARLLGANGWLGEFSRCPACPPS